MSDMKEITIQVKVPGFLTEHLKLWQAENVPGPRNELQSISAWLKTLGMLGPEKTADAMRQRMLLLMHTAEALHGAGPEAEKAAGIYEKAPDMDPNKQTQEIKQKPEEKWKFMGFFKTKRNPTKWIG